MLAGGAYTAWLLYQAPFMRQLWIYLVGALFVFWFSVSGGMHNIIRGVPLYFFNQQGQARTMNLVLSCVCTYVMYHYLACSCTIIGV